MDLTNFIIPVSIALLPSVGFSQSTWDVPGEADSTKVIRSDANGNRVSTLRPGFVRSAHSSTQQAVSGESWKGLGPFGGDVAAVAMSPTTPNVVLAGLEPALTQGTMFRSADGGASWGEVNVFAGLDVKVLEFANDGTAFAGTLD
jgi:hypothetical protein